MTRDVTFSALGVALLAAVTLVMFRIGGLGRPREVLIVVARAAAQMTVVGLVIAAVLKSPALAPLYLAVMLTAASITSTRRIAVPGAGWRAATAAIVSAASVTVLMLVISRAVAFDARHIVPLAAQVIGGAMTATSLAGQRFVDQVTSQWVEVEGWLALGATPTVAVREQGRIAASRSLVPALDQTRNVGLVVLPGAYVGLLLGGASPFDAGRLQLLVLVGLLSAQSVAVVVVTRLLGPSLGTRRAVAAA